MSSNDPNLAATARQQLIVVEGFTGYFATKTGGEVTAEAKKVYDGGRKDPEVQGGPAETSNLVLTRPYRMGLHQRKLAELAAQVGTHRCDVSVYDTDPDLGPWGEPQVYAGALLVRVKRPDADAASTDTGSFELEFAVSAEA